MKKNYILISSALFISIFIYLFYRTEKTVVNELLIRLISLGSYTNLRATIAHALPLNNIVVYSLPEGLWIFCITLTSKPYYIYLNKRHLDCVYIPLIFCFSLEFMQLVNLTNGRFDWMDILVSMIFWLTGRYLVKGIDKKRHLLTNLNSKTLVCLISYGIVYLAHVHK